MSAMIKNASPFSPAKPVLPEFFVGRQLQIQRIMQRGVGQVAGGKPMAVFVEGEYGIGKSSIAHLIRWLAYREHGMFGIYAPLGGARNLTDVAEIILEQAVRTGVLDPTRWETLRNFLAKYVGNQQASLFGFDLNLNIEALKADAPNLASHFGLLSFLGDVFGRLPSPGCKGIVLILDEINGIASDPQFSMFLKSLWDSNALSPKPLPLLLMLCGTKDRRFEMMQQHEPVERIFDLVQVDSLSKPEMEDFFRKAFDAARMTIAQDALDVMAKYSAGFPRIMHLVGDAAYWLDNDGAVSSDDALGAVIDAAEELGRKFVDAQVYQALQSRDYHSILQKIGKLSPDSTVFRREEVVGGLTDPERKKFDNFVSRMKTLNVVRQGSVRGEYEFTMRMVRLYIWIKSTAEKQ